MPSPLYLLDTNILLHLIRGQSTGLYIDATFRLQDQANTPLVCIVSHGEIWSLAREHAWGQRKRLALEVMLDTLVTVDIRPDQVVAAYVDIEDVSRRTPGGAVKMGQNDLWIAAVAKVTGATLLTCDKDFDHLDPGQITRIYIDPRSALPPAPATTPVHRSDSMSNHSQQIVQKLWNYCNVLRDDGLSYGDYVEQLTYLLFLKMAHEQTQPPWRRPSPIPEGFDWPSLTSKDGDALEVHYRHILETLGKRDGMLGVVFRKAQNKIQDPAKLRRLIADLIDRERWRDLDADVKGDAYEGLLEKNAQDTKGGAGQYFTPRPLIQAIVDVMRPAPGETICDPACGTGGFLLAAHDHIARRHPNLDKDQKRHLKLDALRGVEIVDGVARLCAMNLILHGVGPEGTEGEPPVQTDDSLRGDPGDRFDLVLTNPPFGKKSSVMVVNASGDQEREALTVVRDDFWASTSNKQLNFLQHVKTLLKVPGRAAVVVPDNVLFEGGAGETIRRKLLHECDVHTLLRLPTGIFYAQGVKANVLFFDRKPASATPWTQALWIYDLRTNMHLTLKTNPLKRADLDDFVTCYRAENRHERQPTWSESNPQGRWRSYPAEELLRRDKVSLDLFWLRDESLEDSANLADPDVIAAEIVEDLRAALEEFELIQTDLTDT